MKAERLNQATAIYCDRKNYFLYSFKYNFPKYKQEVDATAMMTGNAQTILPNDITKTILPNLFTTQLVQQF